jgi:hypothetical protein
MNVMKKIKLQFLVLCFGLSLVVSGCNDSAPLVGNTIPIPNPVAVPTASPVVSNLPQRANLLGEYLLLEGTGATINDTSGKGNTATLTGAAWEGSSDLKFTAQGQYIQLPTALNQLNTLQLVIYEPAYGSNQTPTGYGDASASPSHASVFCGTDVNHSCVTAGNGLGFSQKFQAFNSSGTISSQSLTGGWHIVTMVSGQAPALDHIYYDGIEVAAYSVQGSGYFLHPTTGNYQIGGSAQYDQTWFYGKIAAAWAWSASLNSTEVSAAYTEAVNFINYKGVQTQITPIIHTAPMVIGSVDSRTEGVGLNANNSWIQTLTLTDPSYTAINLGSSGMWAIDAAYSFNILHAPYINIYSGPVIEVIWGGVSDMVRMQPPALIADGLRSMVQQSKALGARVVIATEISFLTAAGDAQKNALNAIIRSEAYGWGVDNIADLGTSPQVGMDGAYNSANFVDKIHPNDAGEVYIRAIMSNAVNELIGSTQSSRHTTSAANYVEVAGYRYLDLTGGAPQTITLPDCVGYSLSREIVNLGAGAATLATTNAEVLTGSSSIPVYARAVLVAIPAAPAVGGCSWQRVE